MKQGDSAYERSLKETLLGRLRLKLRALIGEKIGKSLKPCDIRKYVMHEYRKNHLVGDICRNILSLNNTSRVAFTKFSADIASNEFLQFSNGLSDGAMFLEVTGCPTPWPDATGLLVLCQPIGKGSASYYCVIFCEDSYPDNVLGLVSLFVSANNTKSKIAVYNSTGWHTIPLNSANQSPQLLLSMQAIRCLQQFDTGENDTIPSEFDHSLVPPEDMLLDGKLHDLKVLRTECSQTDCALDVIRPHSKEFCLKFPIDIVEKIAKSMQERQNYRPALLVYWNGEHFVMSDDYGAYLAYRSLHFERVPVVIIGKFPVEITGEIRKGGSEMLPPPLFLALPREKEMSEDSLEVLLDARLRRSSQRLGNTLANLYAFHIVLCELLDSKGTSERDLHDLLREHPVLLDPHGASIHSEVKLGSKYRIDLLIQQHLNDRQITLVELENHQKKIFTKAGRVRSEITHALQQVEDWLRWWRENPRGLPLNLDSTLTPKGLVVVGRANKLTIDERQRLLHLNQNRHVQLITYDDLLDRIETLINNLEQIDGEKQ